jgi:hypothetical protein
MYHKHKWKLLPSWFKAVILLYSSLAIVVFSAFILSLLGFVFPLSIYGISVSNQYSPLGVFVFSLFALKGCVGYLFIAGHQKAPIMGILDAIIGIACCVYVGFIRPFYDHPSSVDIVFRLELIVLIPFLWSSAKLKRKWPGPFKSSGIKEE